MPDPIGVRLPEFSEYVGEMFQQQRPETVVEVGPDVQLSLMPRLGHLCGRYVGLTLPEYHKMSQGWFGMHQDMGVGNIELIEGNAVDLPDLVPQADFIIVHNVLLELEPGDTALMWEYRRGEREPDEEMEKMRQRFASARGRSYKGFLEVANPGQVLTFHRTGQTDSFVEGVTEVVGVDPGKVSVVPLQYDGGDRDKWELVIIENR